MTAFDLPLFGEPDPVQRPGKTALGYVFLVRGGLVREALIDLDELRVIRWVTR